MEVTINRLPQMSTINNLTKPRKPQAQLQHNDACNSSDNETVIRCPTCETSLRRFEVAEHCEQEMERLRQLNTSNITELQKSLDLETSSSSSSSSLNNNNDSETNNPRSVFQRVQKNRQTRLRLRVRKRPPATEHPCPVCNINFPENDIHMHVESCLRQNATATNGGRRPSDGNSSNDDELVEEYEEYEWAGQKRIRASSLLQGGYAACGIGQPLTHSSSNIRGQQDDDDEDLNVDEDDTQIYGPIQYSESDVITPKANLNDNESDVTAYVRHLITGSTNNNHDPTSDDTELTEDEIPSKSDKTATNTPNTISQFQQIIDSLKVKINAYENQMQSKHKCLICLDDYRNPAVSVACWHVHCEQCWLRSLGARKLCPQCNLITTPKDLRRIYM